MSRIHHVEQRSSEPEGRVESDHVVGADLLQSLGLDSLAEAHNRRFRVR